MSETTEKPDAFETAFAAFSELGDKPITGNVLDALAGVTGATGEAPPAAGGTGAVEGIDATGATEITGDTGATGATGEAPPVVGGTGATGEAPPASVAATGGTGSAQTPPAPTAPAAATGATGSSDDALNRLADLIQGRTGQAPPPAPPAPTPEPPIYTAEETAAIEAYEKDWPDVVKGEALRRRQEYRTLMTYMFQQVDDYVRPMQEMLGAVASIVQANQLTTAIPDYSDHREKVLDWIEKQPPYLAAAYKHVAEAGSAAEVADLFERYRKDTGVGAAAVQAPAQTPKPEPVLPPAAIQAAARLAPVQSGRTIVSPAGVDANDFDTAWSQAARS